jgi:YegS/Rv2252/BmrU family lipid kinase
LTRRVRALGAELRLTEHPGQAYALSAAAVQGGCATVVAVGGDGTVNEVARALAGTPVVLGIIATGSGNGLARHLGIHGSWDRAFATLRNGQPRAIDVGFANGCPFLNVAGLGFEAELAERFNRARRRGLLAYAFLTLRALRTAPSLACRIRAGDSVHEFTASTVAVANASQYGGGLRIAPRARVDDGRLDLCALPPLRWNNLLPLTFRLRTGGIGAAKGVLQLQAPAFTVELPGPARLHTDGETHLVGSEVHFVVQPGHLRVLCPDIPKSR